MATINIPKFLWQSLDSLMYNEARNYLTKVAEILRVPASDLIKAVIPSKETLKIIMYDCESLGSCRAWIAHPDRPDFAIHCKKPTTPGEDCCAEHKHSRTSIQRQIDRPQILRPINTGPDMEPLWLNEDDQVVNCHGKIRGRYLSDKGRLIIYNIHDDAGKT